MTLTKEELVKIFFQLEKKGEKLLMTPDYFQGLNDFLDAATEEIWQKHQVAVIMEELSREP